MDAPSRWMHLERINCFSSFAFQIKDNQETAELIVNKSIELWQQNKEHTEFRALRKSNWMLAANKNEKKSKSIFSDKLNEPNVYKKKNWNETNG